MRLVITVDIDLEESGLSPKEVKEDIMQFTRNLLILGASEQEIGLTLRKVKDKMVAEKPKKMKNSCGTKQHGNRKLENLPIAKNVVKIMYEDELSEKDVAKRAGYSEQEFRDILDSNRIITAFDITKLYTALGVDANALFR